MSGNSGFVLQASSADELKSSTKALPIVATCVYGNIPLRRQVAAVENDKSSFAVLTPPATGRMTLQQSSNTNPPSVMISSTNAALRWLASSPGQSSSSLLLLFGETLSEQCIVDSWLYFTWSNFDLPIEVMIRDDKNNNTNATEFTNALQVLDNNLLYNTYIAGTKYITIADIRLIVSLYNAIKYNVWNPNDEMINVKRWYETIVHQDWFIRSLSLLSSLQDTATATTLTTASSSSSNNNNTYAGVLLNGIPTPVINTMYRRNRIRMKELFGMDGGASYIGQTITVAGWSRTIQKMSSKLIFVNLNDGSIGSTVQCVLHSETTAGFEQCKANGGTGSSFLFTGQVIQSVGEGQVIDIQVTNAELLGAVYGGNQEGTIVGGMLYPLSKKEHTLEHMRDVAHLRARGKIHAAAMRIRHAMAYATHTFFHNHGFLYIHTPIITGADCEGAGEQFAVTTLLGSDHLKPDITLPIHKAPEPPPAAAAEGTADGTAGEEKKISKSEMKRLAKKQKAAEKAGGSSNNKGADEPAEGHHSAPVIGAIDYNQDFFAQRVNLTVSGQLNVETHACALCDVYTFGPTFRAEESRTYRHLSEFWMIEPEIAFADLQTDIDLAEDYLKYCVQYALQHCSDDLEFFENNPHGEKNLRERLKNVLENQFKRLTYTEAIEILQQAVADGVQFEVKPEWGIDLPSEHERYICEKVFKMPVVLTNYPKEIKAFYMKVNDDNKTVAAADILVPKIGEIIGGSQREHRYEVLKQRCIDMGLDPKAVWWYLDLRRYGTVPHAGFGLGFERLILFITGLDNIRDVIPFPRWVGNAKF